VLYVCGEESPSQVSLRVRRLTGSSKNQESNVNLKLGLAETDVDVIVQAATQEKPSLMIVDSIQTLFTQDLSGMAGSVGQVRESANRLIGLAKSTHVAIMLVGHVTKEGNVAGPKVLEHMVDTVLVLEGERTGMWRILKTQKNRFGATDEVGVFLMEESGLTDVANPSSAFLAETSQGVAGSAVAALLEGTRVMLVEIQALVVSSQLAMPRRVSQGIAPTKLQLIAAILQKHARLPLGDKDIFVNVAGGLKVNEPAVDVAIAVAIASSLLNKPVEAKAVFAGELGLLGEVRQVSYLDKRIKEAKRLGYEAAYTAKFQANLRRMLEELGMRGGKRGND
jgi:DNA repair protein RadA/Sms